MLSRPCCVPRTSPASSMTRRCLVIPCRLIPNPAVNLAIDSGPSPERRETRPSRVSSPNAAKIEAELASSAFAFTLLVLRKVLLDKGDDLRPAFFVRAEGLGAPLEGNPVEPRLRDRQQYAVVLLLERELDERRRFLRVVDARFHGIWVPTEREQAFGFDPLDDDVEGLAGVRLLGFRDLGVDLGANHHAPQRFPDLERTVELHAEPASELLGVGNCLPHPRPW